MSLKFIISFWLMNCFASLICCPPRKQAMIGLFVFSIVFATSIGCVIRCGVKRIMKRSVSFSVARIVFS